MSPPDSSNPPEGARYLNRELSMLEFQARVLALAEDPTVPLLERAKFLAIFSGNVDEFFQVRVAGIKEQLAVGAKSTSDDGLDQVQQLRAIRARVEELVARQATAFTKEISPALQEAGVAFTAWSDLEPEAQDQLTRVFEDRIFPVLTPLAVDPAHPFPYISNLSLNLAVSVRDRASGEERFARVKVPPLLPRFVTVPDSARYVPLEQVIAAHLDALFPGMDVLAQHPFRVTRDADIELSDEAEDLLVAMEMSLRQRTKFGLAVRLEVDTNITPEVLALLCRELELGPNDVYQVDAPLDLSGLWDLYSLRRPELKYPQYVSQNPPPLAGGKDSDVFWAMRSGDVLLHHPYDSFANSVEAFVEQAASDDAVLAIKQALYRTGGDEAGIVASLVKAAEAGKQVVALVELKARFDEQANIERARMLEQAGAHVVYGLVGLKTHAKVLLVVRQEADGIRRYCHFGTGNYNPKTATTYEDLGVLSSDPDLGSDLSELFNHLTGYSRPGEYRRLLVAPEHLRNELRDLIRGAGPRRRCDHDEDQRARRLRHDRRALRGVGRGRGDQPHRAQHLLPARRRTRPVREHHGALDRRALPRALADHPFRTARQRRRRVRHRVGRSHAPQPRPARRGHVAHQRPAHARPARRDSRHRLRRRRVGVDARTRRYVAQGAHGRGHRGASALPGVGDGPRQGPLARSMKE